MAEKKSKDFVLFAPDGTVHEGRNLYVFCQANDLNTGAVSGVCRGVRPQYKGWTGMYGTLEPDLVGYFDHDG
jgi:hypothetical protein